MSDLEEVTVSAFVPRGNPVTLIEASELRKLRAENKVLRFLAEYLCEAVWEEFEAGDYPGFEKFTDFVDNVEAVLHGYDAPDFHCCLWCDFRERQQQ